MPHPIAFARNQEGRIVDVRSVPRGLACDCVCPQCGARLVANQGRIKEWYFSHESGSDCPGGAETALHLAAKQLILAHLRVALPPLVVEFRREHPQFGLYERSREVRLPEKLWRFRHARDEMRIGPYIADIAGRLGEEPEVVVEVKVRHEVEPEKAQYLRANRLPSIEIDLLPLLGESLTLEQLAWHVIESDTNRKWVSNSGYSAVKAEMLAEYEAWVASKNREATISAYRRVTPPPQPPRKADEPSASFLRLREEMTRLELRAKLGLKDGVAWPEYLHVPIRQGANFILAPLDIWQGAVFIQFIHDANGASRVRRRFSLSQVMEWLTTCTGGPQGPQYQVSTALRLFLEHLIGCGFLKRDGTAYTVLHGRLLPSARCFAPALAKSSWTWRERWPLEEVALERAADALLRQPGAKFNARRFVDILYRMPAEPSDSAVKTLVAQCGGSPDWAFDLLRDIGVVEQSWRILREGVAPPWLRV